MAADRLSVGQRVRIHPDVTRSAWGAPCNWGGMEGTVTGGGGRVSGVRVWRVALHDDQPFGGNDFTEGMLEPVATTAPQAELFASHGVIPSHAPADPQRNEGGA